MNIASLIRELLLQLEKTVIPGFGSFSIVSRSAELNKVTGVLNPPARDVIFDERMQADDGRLLSFIARKQGCSKAEATDLLGTFVKSVRQQLDSNGTAIIEGIGYLGRDKSGKFSFQPSKEIQERVNAFGLPKLEIHQIPSPTARATVPRYSEPVTVSEHAPRRIWRIVAVVAALVLGLAAVIYFTGIYRNFTANGSETVITPADQDTTDRLVFGNRTNGESDSLQESISQELDKRTAREEALRYEEQTGPAEPVTGNAVEPQQPSAPPSGGPYHIISGAFQVSNNAERQKALLEKKGFSPELLPKRGNYYMVSLGSYDTREMAAAAMQQMKVKLGQELWVMKVTVSRNQ